MEENAQEATRKERGKQHKYQLKYQNIPYQNQNFISISRKGLLVWGYFQKKCIYASFFFKKACVFQKKAVLLHKNLDITKQNYLCKTIFNGIQHSKIRYYP